MTPTTILTDHFPESPNIPRRPSDILMNLIAALLAPMFLGITAGDVALARLAAIETINAYQARNHADLIGIAQIIAYGLAALGSLSLSMSDDISLNMTLRLRGNANALDRSAEHNRRVLRETHHTGQAQEPEDTFEPADAAYEAEVLANLAATQKLIAEAQASLYPAEPTAQPAPVAQPTPIAAPKPQALTLEERQHQAAWAQAMTEVADEFTASIANLPPSERKDATRRAALLNGCATELLSGTVPPRLAPGDLAAFLRLDAG
jgi:hypothetical protein